MEDIVPLQAEGEDRRIFARRDFGALLRFAAATKHRHGEGITRNISASGAAFITKDKLSPKERLELWIAAPQAPAPIHKTAQVVWVKENLLSSFETGVEFDSVGLMELSGIFKNF